MTITPELLAQRLDALTLTYELTAREREITVLRVAGASPREICDKLGIADGTYRAASWRAASKLRDALPSLGDRRMTTTLTTIVVQQVALGKTRDEIDAYIRRHTPESARANE